MFTQAHIRIGVRVLRRFSHNASSRKHNNDLPRTPRAIKLFTELVRMPENKSLRVSSLMAKRQPELLAEELGRDSQSDEIKSKWAAILAAQDFDAVLAALSQLGVAFPRTIQEAPRPPDLAGQLPSVVAHHIFFNQARSRSDTMIALLLVEDHLSVAPPSSRLVIAISAIARLSELNLVAPLRGLLQVVLDTPEATEQHCNVVLRALTLAPSSKEAVALVLQVISTMRHRSYKLHQEAYRVLLQKSYITAHLARDLGQVPKTEGFQPNPRQDEMTAQAMIRHGRRGDARRLLKRPDISDATQSSPSVPQSISLPVSSARTVKEAIRRVGKRRTVTWSENSLATPSVTPDAEAIPMSSMITPDWVSVLDVSSKDEKCEPSTLLGAFYMLKSRFTLDLASYETVIRGLLRKRDPSNALTVWQELRDAGLALNAKSVGLGVRALATAGHPLRAFELLEEADIAHRREISRPSTDRRSPMRSKSVNIVSLNQFMAALRHLGRPDAVFALWDSMGALYRLSPDACTLNTLLMTARWANKYDHSLKGVIRDALEELGLRGNKLDSSPGNTKAPERRKVHVKQMEKMLDPSSQPRISGRWGSERASLVALRIAVTMFIGNWPRLKQVHPPVHASRRAASDVALSPLSDALHSLSYRMDAQPGSVLPRLVDGSTPLYLYPTIYPTDVTFRAFLDILALESLHAEIPTALAWMRFLHVRPSKNTLATALVHWHEVSMDAPLIEKLKGGSARSPYTILMSWMRSWVGEENMPTRSEMTDALNRLEFFRQSRYT